MRALEAAVTYGCAVLVVLSPAAFLAACLYR